jgi:hypothetical protein
MVNNDKIREGSKDERYRYYAQNLTSVRQTTSQNSPHLDRQPSRNALGPIVLDRVPIALPRPIIDPEELVSVHLNTLTLEDRVGA